MKFSKYVFIAAGIYGLIVTVPMYFSEAQFGAEHPPVITHPEYFYGFIGVVIAWQILFFLIARDPERYRLMMIPAVLEKMGYAATVFILFSIDRITAFPLTFAGIDLALGALFIAAFILARPKAGFY